MQSSKPPAARRTFASILLTLCFVSSTIAAQHSIEVRGVQPDAPFAVEAWADASRIVIDLRLQADWYTYATDVGGGEPLSLKLEGSEVRAVGALRLPKDVDGQLDGRVRIEQWIHAKPGAKFLAKLSFMVCDPMQCLPPMELTLSGEIRPLRVLLVTSSEDAHAKRIQSFLESRKLSVTSSTYDEVDLATADAHDVVLAASKLFREDGKGGRKASSFPKTRTPIVAVGFLGTNLVEQHGIAMTSGYI